MALVNVTIDMSTSFGEFNTRSGLIMNSILSDIETIVEETGCKMSFGDSRGDGTSQLTLSFRDERQEECVMSMLKDLVLDHPQNVTLEVR